MDSTRDSLDILQEMFEQNEQQYEHQQQQYYMQQQPQQEEVAPAASGECGIRHNRQVPPRV